MDVVKSLWDIKEVSVDKFYIGMTFGERPQVFGSDRRRLEDILEESGFDLISKPYDSVDDAENAISEY